METKVQKTLSKIPVLLNSIEDEEGAVKKIFDEVNDIIKCDYALVYYINDERATLKFNCSYLSDNFIEKLGDYASLNLKLKKQIFNNDDFIADEKSVLIKGLNLDINNSSYLVTKLSVKSAVFGLMVLVKREANFYDEEDLYIAKTLSSVISYAIKDIELTEVFKLQLKSLQENIIEKMNAYKTIKEQNEKIVESERAKSEFFANMSHELRTPLNAIIGFSDSLESKIFGELNKKQAEYVNDIKVSGIHLLGMINEILDMAKLESHAMKLSLRCVDLNMTVQETINIVQPLADKKKIEITFVAPENIVIEVDYQKIQQIMFNFLSNAIKYTSDGGDIIVVISQTEDEVSIAVKDSGIGIDKKYQGKIFEKFVQLDNIYTKTGSSTGLGLAITKELVEMHNGRITLESKPKCGSTFTVYLPKSS